MTECSSCELHFSGTSAFDQHRVGRHEYTLWEGLQRNPTAEDGRRCLNETEMVEAGMERDAHGRWRVVASEKQLAGLARMRAGAPTKRTEATEGLGDTSERAAA